MSIELQHDPEPSPTFEVEPPSHTRYVSELLATTALRGAYHDWLSDSGDIRMSFREGDIGAVIRGGAAQAYAAFRPDQRQAIDILATNEAIAIAHEYGDNEAAEDYGPVMLNMLPLIFAGRKNGAPALLSVNGHRHERGDDIRMESIGSLARETHRRMLAGSFAVLAYYLDYPDDLAARRTNS